MQERQAPKDTPRRQECGAVAHDPVRAGNITDLHPVWRVTSTQNLSSCSRTSLPELLALARADTFHSRLPRRSKVVPSVWLSGLSLSTHRDFSGNPSEHLPPVDISIQGDAVKALIGTFDWLEVEPPTPRQTCQFSLLDRHGHGVATLHHSALSKERHAVNSHCVSSHETNPLRGASGQILRHCWGCSFQKR